MSTSNHPWPCAIHNPDNLTPEQFGDPKVWRPATPDEMADVPHKVWCRENNCWRGTTRGRHPFGTYSHTYRIRLADRPWPVAKPADLTDADPCPKEPPHGWVEVTSGERQQHDWMLHRGEAHWCKGQQMDVAYFLRHAKKGKIYRHPARMPKAEEKAIDWQARAEKADAILAECMAIMPHGHTPSHTAENLPGRIGDLAGQLAEECTEREKAEAELAALKARRVGVLLPIVEPLPPVPEGCVRKYVDEESLFSTNQTEDDQWFIDIQLPAPPDERAEFEAAFRPAFPNDDWSRAETGEFAHGLMERLFQHWLNAGGDK